MQEVSSYRLGIMSFILVYLQVLSSEIDFIILTRICYSVSKLSPFVERNGDNSMGYSLTAICYWPYCIYVIAREILGIIDDLFS